MKHHKKFILDTTILHVLLNGLFTFIKIDLGLNVGYFILKTQ